MERNSDGSLTDEWLKAVTILGKVSKSSGKERATDVPSWAKGQKPREGENGKDFAKRLMDEKYGEGNWSARKSTEYSQLKKFGDRWDK